MINFEFKLTFERLSNNDKNISFHINSTLMNFLESVIFTLKPMSIKEIDRMRKSRKYQNYLEKQSTNKKRSSLKLDELALVTFNWKKRSGE